MRKGSKLETIFDTYKIVKKIGEGGCANVYQVKTSDENIFAVKVLERINSSEKAKRFRNELNFSFKSDHPNIMKVSDYGGVTIKESIVPFYVMPLYKGNLREFMDVEKDANKFINIIISLLEGLEYSHNKGIVHRDIKPENIMMDNDIPIISDFGIAKFNDELKITTIETKKNSRLANFQYCAPEQKEKNRMHNLTVDLYAIGLILNEYFTKKIPNGANFSLIQEVAPDFGYLDNIVERLIDQNPNKRFQSSRDVIKEIILCKDLFTESEALNKIKDTETKIYSNNELMKNAPIIIGVDWDNDVLRLELDKNINDKWISAFRAMGNYQFTHGYEPERFDFGRNVASVTCPSRLAQQLVDNFKSWLPTSTEKYNAIIEEENRILYREEQKRREIEIRKHEERLNVMSSLKF